MPPRPTKRPFDVNPVGFGPLHGSFAYRSLAKFPDTAEPDARALRWVAKPKLLLGACKGIVLSIEVPDRRVIFQAVGRRVDIAMEDPWGNRIPRTQVVAIGAKGAVEKSTLEAIFNYRDDN